MDSLCGFGLPELIIVAGLAFVLIGPERSRDIALKAGRLLRKVLTSPWWRDFNQVATSIRDLPNTLMRMAEIEEAQADIKAAVSDIRSTTQVDPTVTGGAPSTGRMLSQNPWGLDNAVSRSKWTSTTPSDESDEPTTDDTDAN